MIKVRVSQFISGILSFMMMICITFLVVFISLSLTLFHSGFISDRMDDRYYQSALDSLVETLKNEVAPPSNIPEEVYDGLFNAQIIREDSKANVSSILVNIDDTFDSSRIHRLIMDRFTEYAHDNNINITETNLDTLADYCLEEYERQISVPYLKSFAPIRLWFENAFTYVLLIFSVLLILLALFLFRIHTFKHRAVRYCTYSLFASALMIVPVPLLFLIQGSYNKINISPEHVRMLFASVVGTTLRTLVVSGLVLAVLGAISIFLTHRMRQKAIRGERDY